MTTANVPLLLLCWLILVVNQDPLMMIDQISRILQSNGIWQIIRDFLHTVLLNVNGNNLWQFIWRFSLRMVNFSLASGKWHVARGMW